MKNIKYNNFIKLKQLYIYIQTLLKSIFKNAIKQVCNFLT